MTALRTSRRTSLTLSKTSGPANTVNPVFAPCELPHDQNTGHREERLEFCHLESGFSRVKDLARSGYAAGGPPTHANKKAAIGIAA